MTTAPAPLAALVALLLVAQTLLLHPTFVFETTRTQERIDAEAADLRQHLARHEQSLQALDWSRAAAATWRAEAAALLRAHREIVRIERHDAGLGVAEALEPTYRASHPATIRPCRWVNST